MPFAVALRHFLLLAGLLLLAACAAPLKQQTYNREANQSIKRIAVLPMRDAEVSLQIFNNVGNNFGLIGVLISEGNRNAKETWLQDAVRKAGFDQHALLKAELTEKMAARGYELVWPEPLTLPAKQIKPGPFGLRKNYAPVAGVDAQLDLGLGFVGYACAGSGRSQPYRPTVYAALRLVSADGKEVLFADEVQFHNVLDNKQAILVEPDGKHVYPDFDDLKAADGVAVEGLVAAVAATATAIAGQF